MNKHAKLLSLLIIILVIAMDQLTKWWALSITHIPLLWDIFSFTYAENKGIAFSMPLEGLVQQIITALLTLLLIAAYFKYKVYEKPLLNVGVSLMIGGALGNAYDRFFRGFVVDFIHVGTFPIFNIADSAVTIGVICILIHEFRKKA